MSKNLLHPNYIKAKIERKNKTYKGEWYSINSIMGNHWAWGYILLGGWEAGKSYAAMRWAVKRKIENRDGVKLYWMRLTEAAVKNMMSNDADGVVDPGILSELDIKITRNANVVYTYDAVEEKGKQKKANRQELMKILSCSTFFNDKGKAHYDQNYKGEYIIVLDEMNRESFEANRFDVVYTFARQLENLVRSNANCRIRVIMIGNNTDEASDLLSAFNFIPDGFGRYKLKRKGIVIDYIKPNEKYEERRKTAIANQIIGFDDAATTNEYSIDRSMLTKDRCIKPSYTIMFGKTPKTWFTLWDERIIKSYNNEITPKIPMKRYLDAVYHPDKEKQIRDMFDQRYFRYRNISDFKKFQKQLRLLKKS